MTNRTNMDILRVWAKQQGLIIRSGANWVEIVSYSSEPIIRRTGLNANDAALYAINCLKALGIEIEWVEAMPTGEPR